MNAIFRRIAVRLVAIATVAACAAALGLLTDIHPAACVAGITGVFGVMLLSE